MEHRATPPLSANERRSTAAAAAAAAAASAAATAADCSGFEEPTQAATATPPPPPMLPPTTDDGGSQHDDDANREEQPQPLADSAPEPEPEPMDTGEADTTTTPTPMASDEATVDAMMAPPPPPPWPLPLPTSSTTAQLHDDAMDDGLEPESHRTIERLYQAPTCFEDLIEQEQQQLEGFAVLEGRSMYTESGAHVEYGSVAELVAEFRACMSDPRNVEAGAIYLYESLIDEMILGAAFEVHYAQRTGLLAALEGQPEAGERPLSLVTGPDCDVFGANCTKIAMDCQCPKCERTMAALRFAPHLEKCMGMGRISARIASRRLASSRDGSSYFSGGGGGGGGAQSDDEDDADWSGEKRKKKIAAVRTNGGKKNGKSSS